MQESLTLYLAGPITDFSGHRQAFDDAKAAVTALGHQAISPLDLYPGDNWKLAMQADIPALLQSDGICLLPGWPKSRGAKCELNLALSLDLRVFVLVDGELAEVTNPSPVRLESSDAR